jgi:hypothetical protein
MVVRVNATYDARTTARSPPRLLGRGADQNGDIRDTSPIVEFSHRRKTWLSSDSSASSDENTTRRLAPTFTELTRLSLMSAYIAVRPILVSSHAVVTVTASGLWGSRGRSWVIDRAYSTNQFLKPRPFWRLSQNPFWLKRPRIVDNSEFPNLRRRSPRSEMRRPCVTDL